MRFRWESWDLESKFEALGTEFGDPSDLGMFEYHPRISVEYFKDGEYRRAEGDLIHYSKGNVEVGVEQGSVEVVDLRHVRDFRRIDSPESS